MEKFVGAFLRLGLGGMVAVGVSVIGATVILIIAVCCMKCFKKTNKVTGVGPDDINILNSDHHGNHVEMMTSPEIHDGLNGDIDCTGQDGRY